MTNSIFSSNDDDIFEEYVETNSPNETIDDQRSHLDRTLAEIDSPFKNLMKTSSMKVSFADSFYGASIEWIEQGYRESSDISVFDALAKMTNGRFLYEHRLTCCVEAINRKKTILKFVTLILEADVKFEETSNPNQMKVSGKISDAVKEISLSMFFKSFYNIHFHNLKHDVALYKTLCEYLELDVDQALVDLNAPAHQVLSTNDYINSLYVQYLDSDYLSKGILKHGQEQEA